MRKSIFGVFAALAAVSLPLQAADGLLALTSAHSVSETTNRLEAVLGKAGFKVFARVDHGAGAASVDMPLAPTELLIFGKPEAGTVLMQQQATVGIDLPLKYLVWQDADGKVMVGWNDPNWLAARHGINQSLPPLQKMQGALKKFASEAAKP